MPGKKITVDKKLIAASFDRVISDEQFHKDLNDAPVKTLSNLGIQLPTKSMNALKGKRLSEVALVGAGTRANVLVSVGVEAGVSVGVSVATESRVTTKGKVIKPEARVKLVKDIQKRVDIVNKMSLKSRGSGR